MEEGVEMVKVKVTLSHALVSAANNQRETWTTGDTLGEVLDNLIQRYGNALKRKLCDKDGKPKSFINIYINGKDMRFVEGLETKLKKNDEILILPAVSGGEIHGR